ncbi:hypothetical protein PV332_10660 [Streptomyces scabiei]|uniref:hypothetical protein n=1 Tax=Streptomyces scabiei TaxID=1930 RepID=UPI0029AFC914|nr:hypothetical protein [Streptomyces scabiei]MDX2575942.1 hypothetical protein [Streptomyces scabiei]MDX2794049.1 hypothetical protein [Streptomyces scabiei]MDX2885585.1 hypothetical protein [Streptomyces scabiei]MDX2993462.1 hypothetical protein [Streptomyces scabiei]MDX3028424.1 hypothetical protein [Streptomyces scabiei]
MIIITGPQGTDEQRGRLDEMAGLLAAKTLSDIDIPWAEVTDMYCLDGWETCPIAVADMKIADMFGLQVTPLSV